MGKSVEIQAASLWVAGVWRVNGVRDRITIGGVRDVMISKGDATERLRKMVKDNPEISKIIWIRSGYDDIQSN